MIWNFYVNIYQQSNLSFYELYISQMWCRVQEDEDIGDEEDVDKEDQVICPPDLEDHLDPQLFIVDVKQDVHCLINDHKPI